MEVIDSSFEDYLESNIENIGLWYLEKSLIKLAETDVVYFSENWDFYRVCKIENTCAKAYGIAIIEE